jgi:hypothetical protein
MSVLFFESVKRRMPHFFNKVDVLEYTPHSKSKSVKHLFLNSRYVVIDPFNTDLSEVRDDAFNVVISINCFQHQKDYLDKLKFMHRVSSKFVMFSCPTAGTMPSKSEIYYRNLTESDFYNSIDLDLMFETYKFEINYKKSELYFWGVKKSKERYKV